MKRNKGFEFLALPMGLAHRESLWHQFPYNWLGIKNPLPEFREMVTKVNVFDLHVPNPDV